VQVYLVDFGGPGETQVDGFGESRYGVVRNLFFDLDLVYPCPIWGSEGV